MTAEFFHWKLQIIYTKDSETQNTSGHCVLPPSESTWSREVLNWRENEMDWNEVR